MSTDLLIRRQRELLEADVGEDLVGLEIDGGACFGFNQTAKRIWQLTSSPVRLSKLCEDLRCEHNIDAYTCLEDVTRTVYELRDAGLLELVSIEQKAV